MDIWAVVVLEVYPNSPNTTKTNDNEGWTGLFRGNLANIIHVAPCKAIELFAYDTVKKSLTPKHGEKSKA
ncbi:hypothetical protein R6Q57_008391 [Mikania cordata]